jgi:hypothetical protein
MSVLLTATPVPSKQRLQATIKELSRLVNQLPEPVCGALEKSGLVGTWRTQLESLVKASGAVTHTLGTAGDVMNIVNVIRKAVGR